MEFTKDLEIGVLMIDKQHKELFDRINAVVRAGAAGTSKEETQKTLDFLRKYVLHHFSDEENLMRSSTYPKFDEHKKLHAAYIKNVDDLIARFNKEGASVKFTLDLNKAVIDWMVKHIKFVDSELVKYVK